jgi:hypothetical protein
LRGTGKDKVKSLRRWFQFKLRTLLLLVSLLAIWLGWQTHQARQQRLAVADVEAIGGVVSYSYEADDHGYPVADSKSSIPSWLVNLVGKDFFYSVIGVDFPAPEDSHSSHPIIRVYDKDAILLSRLPRLRRLRLDCTQIGDEGLRYISRLSQLRSLDLTCTHVTDDGISCLEEMDELQWVSLAWTNVSRSGFERLSRKRPDCQIDWMD